MIKKQSPGKGELIWQGRAKLILLQAESEKQMKLNLQAKMISYFLLVLIIASVGFAVTVWKASDVQEQVNTLKNTDLPRLAANNEIAYNALGQSANVRAYVIYGNEQYLNEYRRLSQTNTKLIDQLITEARTDTAKQLGMELKGLESKYNDIIEKKFLPLALAGKKEEAQLVLVNEGAPVGKAIGEKTAEIKKYRNSIIDKAMVEMAGGAALVKMAAIAAAVLAILFGLAIAYFSARSISKPVGQLAEALQQVADGDLTKQVAIQRGDEIGILAQSFNSMVVQLQKLVKQITFNAEQLAASSEELTASAEQSAQAVNQVAASVTDIAHGSEQQLNAVEETSAVVEQMSASIQQVAATANQVAAHSFKAAEQAQTGDKAVAKAVSQMEHIEQTVNHSAQVVVKLGERSKEIVCRRRGRSPQTGGTVPGSGKANCRIDWRNPGRYRQSGCSHAGRNAGSGDWNAGGIGGWSGVPRDCWVGDASIGTDPGDFGRHSADGRWQPTYCGIGKIN
ncbi:MAG: Methyl-accepting chemotaxis protein signaling domain protein [Firmicutes bacterium]|nr:Methyl-accepting chemotaxis protein signaling domain protein [Bacillota bacterium]